MMNLLRATGSSPSDYHWPRIHWTATLFLLASLVCCALATEPSQPEETLIADTRVLVEIDGNLEFLSEEEVAELRKVRKREVTDVANGAGHNTVGTPTQPEIGTMTTTVRYSVPTGTHAPSTPVKGPSPLPSVLDSVLSEDFTDGCYNFIEAFRVDPTFIACYPFSLLLEGSVSFFQAGRSVIGMTQTVEATCKANVTACSAYIDDLAKNFTKSENCGTDYSKAKQVALDTYEAMLAYAPLYHAACLKDTAGQYCFANAVTNSSSLSDYYFYFLPLNHTLPTGTLPSCNNCTRQTMEIFQAAAANRKLAISVTYAEAAMQVNTLCGPNFVNATLPSELADSGSAMVPSWWAVTAPLLLWLVYIL